MTVGQQGHYPAAGGMHLLIFPSPKNPSRSVRLTILKTTVFEYRILGIFHQTVISETPQNHKFPEGLPSSFLQNLLHCHRNDKLILPQQYGRG